MNPDFQIHTWDNPKELRTQTDTYGNIWFVAKEVCEFFGDSHYLRTLSKLDDDEKGMTHIDTPGGTQKMVTVNESGFYHLLFLYQPQKGRDQKIAQDRLAFLKKFRKWVTSEVLPSIRRTGTYGNPQRASDGKVYINGVAYVEARFIEPSTNRSTLYARLRRARIGDKPTYINIFNPYYNGKNSKRLVRIDSIPE